MRKVGKKEFHVIQKPTDLFVGKQILAMRVAEPVEKKLLVGHKGAIGASPGRAGFFLYM